MTKVLRGGNTNLYKTKVAPKRRSKKVFDYLAKGLKGAANIARKKLPAIEKIAKSAVWKGTKIARQQLRKPSVQKALGSAVNESTKLATNHVLKTVAGSKY